MATTDTGGAAAPRPWGHLATAAWALLATAAALVAGSIVAGLVLADGIAPDVDPMKDARMLGWLFTSAVAGVLVVLVGAAKAAGWSAREYLALTMPSRREAAVGFAAVAALMAALDGTTWLLGRDVIHSSQVDIYKSAIATGAWLPPLIAIVIAAPLGEEILFRGFLFRGWAQTPRQVAPAIAVTAMIWAVLHVQYEWFYIVQIVIIGIVLGWIRWRSGSTLLTILLHGAINAWATLQTIVVMEFLR